MTDPLLVAEGQFAKLFLAIHKPSIVFAARVNQVFTDWDDVVEVTYDGVTTGAYGSILPEMTLLVGTAAGLWDLGVARIRKAADATKLYIGRQSDVRFDNDMYLTVIDDFRPTARQWRVVDESTVYMDNEIAYTNQNVYTDPIPIMGPDAVVKLVGASITHTRNAAGSWSPDGATVSYLWSAVGPAAVTIDDDTAEAPTFTFTAVGEYRITLTASTPAGKSTVAHRRTFVFGTGYLPVSNFNVESISDSQADGGTSFRVTLHDSSALTGTYGHPKVTLFAEDVYGTTMQSFGPLVGYENIVAWGWADQDTTDWTPNYGSLSLEVKGPSFWIDRIDILAAGGLKTGSDNWLFASSVTIDKVLWNLLHWRSNLDTLIDFFPSGDTRVASGLVGNNGSLWEQVVDIAGRIFAKPCCDRYGRLHTAVDLQMMPLADRSAISVIMAITKADWRDKIVIVRKNANVCSQVFLGGTDDAVPYFSKAPGKMVLRGGRSQTRDNILVASQAQTNALAGLLLAQQNNPFPTITIPLRGNNRLIDVVPNQFVTLSMASTDSPLGIAWTNVRLVPRRVTYHYVSSTGEFLADLECELETTPHDGVTYTPPTIPVTPTPDTPAIPDYVFPTPPPTGVVTLKAFGWSLILGDSTNDITTGLIASIEVPFNCTLTSVKLVVKPGMSGSITVNIWKCTYAQIASGVHPVVGDSIGTAVLTSGEKSTTAFSVYLTQGDWLFFNVDSVAGLNLVTLAASGVDYQ